MFYGGATNRSSVARDKVDVVGFGSVAANGCPAFNIIGCEYSRANFVLFGDDRVYESDIVVSSNPRFSFHYGLGAPPYYKHDLWALMTHEVGHKVQLNHADQINQTMYKNIPAGTLRSRTLGKGDGLGMRKIYGDDGGAAADPRRP